MKTFNQQVNQVMKTKSKIESFLNNLSFSLWCVIGGTTFAMMLFGLEIISLENWPF